MSSAILSALISVLLTSACASAPTAKRTTSSIEPAFEVQGHRGARALRPENTLSAFRYALEVGVDTLEMDLNVTRDNVLVVTHDPYLNPDICIDGNGRRIGSSIMVRSLTLKDLKTYDCGTRKNSRFKDQVSQPGERIPTFEEVLTWLQTESNPRAKTVLLNVETKSEEDHPEFTPPPLEFSKRVIEMAKRFKILDRMTLQSFDFRTLTAARTIDLSVKTSALIEYRPRESLAALATRLSVNIVSPNHTWLLKGEVNELHRAGVKVIPWTVNTPTDWKRMHDIEVDGIISDDPKGLIDYRSQLISP